jgi:putative ubiquitin-RnfH superfamily antitoxin RatB of RatAB toxin-antitoxin module
MHFTKRLREGVRSGAITVSVRIWHSPRVTVGKRYAMEEGEIEVDSIEPIGLPDISPELARASGFLGVLDLLKVAQHGSGNRIYLVRFHYIPPKQAKKRRAKTRPGKNGKQKTPGRKLQA